MFRMITISRQYGSGGGAIAGILARRLGWKLVDAQLIEGIAKSANVPPDVAARYDEAVDPWFHGMVKALWRGGYEGAISDPGTDLFDADAMAALWKRVIEEAAQIGRCVIVGRGGQCILGRRKDAFHVSVYAPFRVRSRILRDRLPAGADVAALMEETDRKRAVYVRRYFERDWTDRSLYHMMICSAIGFDKVAEAILCAAGLLPVVSGRGDRAGSSAL